jgi:tripartite-type tricarboxylate transporter receptor subunit TctC
MLCRSSFRSKLVLPLAGVGMLLAAPPVATAQSVEQFYKGRTVTLYVGSAPGGVNDLVGRLVSKHLGNFIPGKPNIVVQNLSGAGGLALANRLYTQAAKDGSVIAIIERSTPQLAVQGDPNAKFDPLKLTWLGSVSSYANDAYVLEVNSSYFAKSVADLKKPGPAVKVGTTGAGSTNVIFTIIAKEILGLNVQVVRGAMRAPRPCSWRSRAASWTAKSSAWAR